MPPLPGASATPTSNFHIHTCNEKRKRKTLTHIVVCICFRSLFVSAGYIFGDFSIVGSGKRDFWLYIAVKVTDKGRNNMTSILLSLISASAPKVGYVYAIKEFIFHKTFGILLYVFAF